MFLFVLCIVGLIVIYYPINQKNTQINKLEKQGENIVFQIELYKKTHHKLPLYLDDLQINLPEDSPFGYDLTHDSLNYVLGFQISTFKTRVYHSETKQWKNID